MAYREERFSARFVGLSRGESEQISAILPGRMLRQRREDILVFELVEGDDFDAFVSLAEQLNLGPLTFGIIASVVTSSDNGGIDLPDFVLHVIRKTRCALTIPITSSKIKTPASLRSEVIGKSKISDRLREKH